MKIAYITAGAAGMYCGSCMKDNTLVDALCALGDDALLIPTYTPIRTDEEDVSQQRIFFGGINVYLQQKSGLFRHTPRWFDRLLDAPGLLRWASNTFGMGIRAEELGRLTLSMLEGSHGKQRKEVRKLADWLANEWKPDVIILTNVLLSGLVPELAERVQAPIVATLQGDDIFLESLLPEYRKPALNLIRDNCRAVAGYIATCNYYADFMAEYLDLPREQMHVVYPGISLKDLEPKPRGESSNPAGQLPLTVGYLARIAPEKGLHILAEAFRHLYKMPNVPPCRLRFSGWLGEHNRKYYEEVRSQLDKDLPAGAFEHVESPDRASKIRFLQSLDVLSVPAPYREPKGLYVLEALACGVPVVQPGHGSFPELIEATGGGLLVTPNDPAELAQGLRLLLENTELRRALGRRGRIAVQERFSSEAMARRTREVLDALPAH
ncbi:MAG TPA: glycosyltransferase family 4 protein [Gemmataceae bacterium]|jgi:glycosyltransferase involved in cell wall biosynthesis|nr:glycosyltransferase family 4 protein [Gemmataceae bacterium]